MNFSLHSLAWRASKMPTFSRSHSQSRVSSTLRRFIFFILSKIYITTLSGAHRVQCTNSLHGHRWTDGIHRFFTACIQCYWLIWPLNIHRSMLNRAVQVWDKYETEGSWGAIGASDINRSPNPWVEIQTKTPLQFEFSPANTNKREWDSTALRLRPWEVQWN